MESLNATATFSQRGSRLIAISIAVLHAAMAITAVNTKSPTFDEPQHLTAGFSYWIRNDFRLDSENGNLPERWAALPLLLQNNTFVSLDDSSWKVGHEGGTAHKFFYEIGNDPDRLIASGRMMMSIFGIGLCLLIYRIGREFFGALGGLIAESIAAFDPNLLAHSALVTSDVAATFFFSATIWSSWRLFQKISPARFALAALSLSGLFLTKFSALIVLPIIGIGSLVLIFSNQAVAAEFGKFQSSLSNRWEKAFAIATSMFFLGVTVVFAIWLSFSFRYSAWTDGGLDHKGTVWRWNYLLEGSGPFEKTIVFARSHYLLPEAYLYGLAYVHKHEGDRPAFLDNEWSAIGFLSFFPRAFLYKTTVPLLCLIALAIVAGVTRRIEPRYRRCVSGLNLLLAFALVYWLFVMRSPLNIGHRHILPIYPALFIACGAVAYLLQRNHRTIFGAVAAILLCWQIGESLAIRPNYLAYFNQMAGGPTRGYKHLVDSSLDWGQDLPALKAWLDDHSAIVDSKPVYLAYFGTADPRWYDISARRLPEDHSTGDRAFAPLGGGIYCVSATTLQGVYADEKGPWSIPYERHYQNLCVEVQRYRSTSSDEATRASLIENEGAVLWVKKIRDFERFRFERLCSFLRHRTPDAQIGYSILVFDLNDAEINRALYGAPAELTPEVRVAGY